MAETRLQGKHKPAIQRAVDILKRIKPFTTGNPLWLLPQLHDLDKHERLILCCSLLGDFVVPTADGGTYKVTLLGPLEEGTVLTPLPFRGIGGEVNMEYQLPFEVAFSEAQIAKSDAVIPTLENLASVADSIVSAFIAEGLVT